MGGNKPQRELAGESLVRRTARWAASQSDLVVLALRDIRQAPTPDLPIALDRQAGIGPISALSSAFHFAESEDRDQVLLVGCDQPFLPTDLLSQLAAGIGDMGAAMPVSAGREQPMATLWRVDTVAIEQFIADGGRSLRRYAHHVGAKLINWHPRPDEDPFYNVNDLEALAEAQRRVRRAEP